MTKKRELFVDKSKESHGDKYNYEEVGEIKNLNKKVIIKCPIHGQFKQRARSHMEGYGCRECSWEFKSNKFSKGRDEAISDFQKVHGNTYDYSQMEYKNSHTKIKIKCEKHGVFEQSPTSHLSGSGCPSCAGRWASNEERILNFIHRSQETHCDLYDYSKVDFNNFDEKIKIVCKKHGDFYQTPWEHWNGNGCGKCAGRNLTDEEWIERFVSAHGHTYIYDKFRYDGYYFSSVIICRKHGEFMQSPGVHARGHGCIECGFERAGLVSSAPYRHGGTSGVYLVQSDGNFIKVGITKHLSIRMKSIQKESRFNLAVLVYMIGRSEDVFEFEQKIIKEFEDFRIIPDRLFAGWTECFACDKKYNLLQYMEDNKGFYGLEEVSVDKE